MASCPCRCGRRVPWLKRGAARQYPAVLEGMRTLREILVDAQANGVDVSGLQECLQQGDRIRSDLLAHLHKQAKPGSHPDLLALSRSLSAWNEQVMATIRSLPFTNAEG